MRSLTENAMPSLKNKSHSVTAEVVIPDGGANGVILNQGGITGGWALYLHDGRPTYHYSFLGLDRATIAAAEPLPPGEHQVRVEFAYDGDGLGKGGTATLYIDGDEAASGRVERTHAFVFSLDETTDVGIDTGSPVSPDYQRRQQRLHRHHQLGPHRHRRRLPRPPHRPRPTHALRHEPPVEISSDSWLLDAHPGDRTSNHELLDLLSFFKHVVGVPEPSDGATTVRLPAV